MTESPFIPWGRLVAEGAAIVISILLAFSIDAWWDNRKDIAEEREILLGLEADEIFAMIGARLEEWDTK